MKPNDYKPDKSDTKYFNYISQVFNTIDNKYIAMNHYMYRRNLRINSNNISSFKKILIRVFKLIYFLPTLAFIGVAYYMFIFVSKNK